MKSIKYIIGWGCVAIAMSLSAQEQVASQPERKIDPKTERNEIRKGNKLFEDKKFTEAEVQYLKALEANPASEIANYNLGAALYKQGKLKEAREKYQKTIQTTSDSLRMARAWHNLGNISFQEQNFAQSVTEYKNALRKNPKDNETRYNLRLAQLKLKEQQQQQQQNDKDKQDQNKQEQQQQQDQQQQNKDNQQDKDQQNKDNQQQNQDKQEQKQQQQQQGQMSKENAQQILDGILQDERETQEKVKAAIMQQQKRKKTDKEW